MNYTTRTDLRDYKLSHIFPKTYQRPQVSAKRYEDCDYVVGLINRKCLHGRVDHNDFTRLKNSYLRQVVHPEYLKKLLVALESEEIIVRDASYRAGEYSMGYKLHKRFADDYHVRVDASPKFIRRAGLQRQLRTLQEIQAERRLPIHNELDAHQHRERCICGVGRLQRNSGVG